jgi:hypothetical protein
MPTTVRRIIAIYQMLALPSTVINAIPVFGRPDVHFGGWLSQVYTFLIAVGVLSFAAGLALWRDRPIARPLTVVVQAVQVLRIANGFRQYSLALGVSFVVDLGQVPSYMWPPVHLALPFGEISSRLYIGVNILAVAALLLVLLWRPTAEPASARAATA